MMGLVETEGRRVGVSGLRAKNEKPLRETLKSLKNLKTAKSDLFLGQEYQALSNTRDYAGETRKAAKKFGNHESGLCPSLTP